MGVIQLRPREYEPLPHNIEAEQALLGSILAYSDSWPLVAHKLKPEQFYEGLHARIYEKVLELSGEGKFVSPVILKSHFEHDETLAEVGGFNYIARLVGAAGPRIGIPATADLIRCLADRRAVMRASQEMREAAAQETDASEFRKSLSAHITGLMSTFDGTAERKTTFTLQEAGSDTLRRLEQLSAGTPDPNAVMTGLAELDEMTGGFRRGEYVVIGARPSMGKTALATQLALNVASRGSGVAYFSLEMPAPILTPRFLSARVWMPGIASPTYQDILRGKNILPEQRRHLASAVQEMASWPLIIEDEPGLSAAELEARARVIAAKLKAKGSGLDLVIVDHVHKMRSPGAQSRVAEYSDISAGLAEAAKRLNIPLIALAQLNRAVEGRDDKRPTLADLRESGAIEQDADVVAFLFRDAYYLERARGKNVAEDADRLCQLARCSNSLEVILAKQRSGPIGSIDLWADMGANVILDRSEAPA